MRRCVSVLLIVASLLMLSACGSDGQMTAKMGESLTIKESPDKYTWYIKNYVGKNCASVGEYSTYSEKRLDEYGTGYLEILFVSPDGEYIDHESNDFLKEYKVVGQSLAPNTELKLSFRFDENGNECDYLIDTQNHERIVLCVNKVGATENKMELSTISPSQDKHTWYIMDYAGRNLANCGSLSSVGDYLVDEYGTGYLKILIVADDGKYVDPANTEQLKKYVVVDQSIEPNTELNFVFRKDENGNEYSYLIESQNIEQIELFVKEN